MGSMLKPEKINDVIRKKIEECDREKEEIYQTLAEKGGVVSKKTGRTLSLKEIEEMIEAIDRKKRALKFMLEMRQNQGKR